MANKAIKQKVQLDFKSNLEEMIKQMKEMPKHMNNKNDLKKLKENYKEAKALSKDLNSSNYKVQKSAEKQMTSIYKGITKNFNKVRKSIETNVSKASNQALKKLESKLSEDTKRLEELQKKSSMLDSGVGNKKDGSGIGTTKASRERLFNEEGSDLVGAKGGKGYDSVLKLQEKINSLKGKEIEKLKKSGKLSKVNKGQVLKELEALRKKGQLRGVSLSNEELMVQMAKQQKYFAKEDADATRREETYSKKQLAIEKQKKVVLEAQGNVRKQMENNSKEALKTKDRKGTDAYDKAYKTGTKAVNDMMAAEERERKEKDKNTNATSRNTRTQEKNTHTVSEAAKNVINYAVVIQGLRKVYRETIRTIKELDSALTEMAIVTSMNRKETWDLLETFQDLAKETGFTTTEISKLSTVYFRQGRTLQEVTQLTRAAAKAARVAAISATDSANYLTSAVNGFGLAADKAMSVSDKFAALASSSASSYEELAVGLSKFASQARIAGVDMDFALGILAKGLETTREAPESMGTAMKSVLARMREIRDYGATLEDGMDVSRVEGALKSIDVKLRDTSGTFRDMQDVLTDVGNAWSGLTKNQQASTAVALAGIRQQSRLLAVMNDFDRTLELVNESQQSEGATMAQHSEYMQSMQAAMAGLTNAWQKFITTITNSEFVIGVIKSITFVIDGLSNVLGMLGTTTQSLVIASIALLGIMKAQAVISKVLVSLGLMEQSNNAMQIFQKGILKKITLEHSAELWGNIFVRRVSIKTAQGEMIANYGVVASLKAMGLAFVSVAKAAWRAIAATAKFTLSLLTNPYFMAAAAIAMLIVGLTQLVKKNKENNISLDEANVKYGTLNYNLRKTNKSMEELISSYDELNRKEIKTEEDVKALKQLEQELQNFGDKQEFVKREWGGGIDWEASVEALNKAIDKNSVEIKKNLSDIFSAAIKEGIKYGFDEGLEEEIGGFLSNFYAEENNLDLSEAQESGLTEFLSNLASDESSDTLDEIRDLINKGYYYGAWNLIGNTMEDLNPDGVILAIENVETGITESKTLNEKVVNYSQELVGLNGEMLEVMKKSFPNLDFLNSLDNSTETSNFLDSADFNYENLNSLISLISSEGLDPSEVLSAMGEQYTGLVSEGILDEGLAAQQTVDTLRWAFEGLSEKVELSVIMGSKSMLSLAQAADKVNSRLINLNESQEKFLSGEMNDQEKYEFMENFIESWSDKDFIKDFKEGNDLSRYLYQNILSVERDYQEKILEINNKLLDNSGAYSKAQKDALVAEKTRLEIMKQYRGVYEGMNVYSSNYNENLEQYNKLQELGIEDDKLRIKMNSNLAASAVITVKKQVDAIKGLKEAFNETLDLDITDYIEEINGVVLIKNQELYDQLDDTAQKYLDGIISSIQDGYSAITDSITDVIDNQIEEEQDLIDDKIDMYKKYFEDLDKLEEDRTKKQDRKDIVAQLQRLEGATDEASRQKAKELRKELNEMDESNAEEERQANRDALLENLGLQKEKIEETYQAIGLELFNKMDQGGLAAATTLASQLDDSGVLFAGEIKKIFEDFEETNSTNEIINDPKSAVQDYMDYFGFEEDLDVTNGGLSAIIDSYTSDGLTTQGAFEKAKEQGIIKKTTGTDSPTYNDIGEENWKATGPDYSGMTDDDTEVKEEYYEKIMEAFAKGITKNTPGAKWLTEADDGFMERIKSAISDPKDFYENKSYEQITDYIFKDIFELSDGLGDASAGNTALWLHQLKNAGYLDFGSNEISNVFGSTSDAEAISTTAAALGYRKGGIVDYTGPAMVHGSSNKPEAFLNAEQTALFSNLRDLLQSVDSKGSNSGSFSIENITIQTQEMNNNQDFKKAGKVLADEFSAAIRRRGLNINVKQ